MGSPPSCSASSSHTVISALMPSNNKGQFGSSHSQKFSRSTLLYKKHSVLYGAREHSVKGRRNTHFASLKIFNASMGTNILSLEEHLHGFSNYFL
ncbi:Protein of unknown function [Gryllus bimaculatus]|nr:Protein of unknown function [Gryllus bimaculatus]